MSAADAGPPVFRGRAWLPSEAPRDDPAALRVVTYNVLAQCYTRSTWFPWSPSAALKWKARSDALLRDVADVSADLLLLQEVDDYEAFWRPQLAARGYESAWKRRTGVTAAKKDGVALAWRPGALRLEASEEVEHNDLAAGLPLVADAPARADGGDVGQLDARTRLTRDCVGLLALFVHIATGTRVVVATTHIYWDPALADVKDAQTAHLLRRAAAFRAARYPDAHLLVGGDFNSVPGSASHVLLLNASGAHSLPPLRSVFGDTEPPLTNHTPTFTATIDYLVHSPGVRVRAVLHPPPRAALGTGLPDALRPSDHLPLVADVCFSHEPNE